MTTREKVILWIITLMISIPLILLNEVHRRV